MRRQAQSRDDVTSGQRWETGAFNALPYVLLAASSVITAFQPMPVNLPAVLGLTLIVVCWVGWFVTVHPQWQSRRAVMGLYFGGMMILAGALVALAPWYGIFALIGYVHAFDYLAGRWRYVGAAVTSMIMAVTYLGGLDRIQDNDWWLWLAISIIATVLATASMHGMHIWLQQAEQQRQTVTALYETNVKLETTLEENIDLHHQLLIQAHQSGVLDERQRISHEIHDTLAQSLAGIVTQLQAAEQTSDTTTMSYRNISNALVLAREGLTEARRTIDAVEPQALADNRLPDAIEHISTRWAQTNDIDAKLNIVGSPQPMHVDGELTLLRVAQETLSNVAKHAQANRVVLTLSYMDDRVTLDVVDDGSGLDLVTMPQQTMSGGHGLVGMRQRIKLLAGTLTIESAPDEGTAISATIPMMPARGTS